jgi:hypothetical protein
MQAAGQPQVRVAQALALALVPAVLLQQPTQASLHTATPTAAAAAPAAADRAGSTAQRSTARGPSRDMACPAAAAVMAKAAEGG